MQFNYKKSMLNVPAKKEKKLEIKGRFRILIIYQLDILMNNQILFQ